MQEEQTNHERIFNILNKVDRIMQSTNLTFGELMTEIEVNYLNESMLNHTNESIAKQLQNFIDLNNIK